MKPPAFSPPAWISGLNPDGTAYIPKGDWRLYASHIVTETPYMSRWILQTPWGGLRLHHIHREDEDRYPHDHPFDFWSLILAGGYQEERVNDPMPWYPEQYRRGSVIRRKATDYHRIVWVMPNTWTLVWFGPKYQSWGFLTPEGKIPWRTHLSLEAK